MRLLTSPSMCVMCSSKWRLQSVTNCFQSATMLKTSCVSCGPDTQRRSSILATNPSATRCSFESWSTRCRSRWQANWVPQPQQQQKHSRQQLQSTPPADTSRIVVAVVHADMPPSHRCGHLSGLARGLCATARGGPTTTRTCLAVHTTARAIVILLRHLLIAIIIIITSSMNLAPRYAWYPR